MRPAGEETRGAEAELAWGSANTTEHKKDPRIDLRDSEAAGHSPYHLVPSLH